MNGLKASLITGFAAIGIGVAAPAGAAIITTATQTVSFASSTTDYSHSGSFNLFDSNLGQLQSITIGATYTENSTLKISNQSADNSTGTANTFSLMTLTSSDTGVNSTLQSVLGQSTAVQNGYGYFTINAIGGTVSFTLPSGSSTTQSSDSTIDNNPSHAAYYQTHTGAQTTSSGLASFEAAGGGSKDVIANTYTGTSISQNGGNSTASQVTTAGGTFFISYNYDDAYAVTPPTDVPEPASLALLGAGLVGMGLVRRKAA